MIIDYCSINPGIMKFKSTRSHYEVGGKDGDMPFDLFLGLKKTL